MSDARLTQNARALELSVTGMVLPMHKLPSSMNALFDALDLHPVNSRNVRGTLQGVGFSTIAPFGDFSFGKWDHEGLKDIVVIGGKPHSDHH